MQEIASNESMRSLALRKVPTFRNVQYRLENYCSVLPTIGFATRTDWQGQTLKRLDSNPRLSMELGPMTNNGTHDPLRITQIPMTVQGQMWKVTTRCRG